MPVADTTALIAVLDAAHASHTSVRSNLQGTPVLHVPTVILSELTVVLRRLAKDHGIDGNRYARTAIAALFERPEVVECQTHDGARARQLYLHDHRLSYADSVAIATAWELGQELVSLDQVQLDVWKSQAL